MEINSLCVFVLNWFVPKSPLCPQLGTAAAVICAVRLQTRSGRWLPRQRRSGKPKVLVRRDTPLEGSFALTAPAANQQRALPKGSGLHLGHEALEQLQLKAGS